MKLTDENYYSSAANHEFFSVSQYKSFKSCEAAAMAELRGDYKSPITKALLVGSFVDSYFEGTLDRFKQEHPEVFTKKAALKAEFRRANEVIAAIKKSDKFMQYLSGEKQRILTAELFGVPWKIKMDSFLPDKAIVDLKVVALIYMIWKWKYEYQGAVYQAVAEKNGFGKLPFYLAIASKQNPPDLDIRHIPQEILDASLREIGEDMPRFIMVKKGLEEPKRCEKCPWCRMTKNVTVKSYVELLEG